MIVGGRDVELVADDFSFMSVIDYHNHPIPDRIVEWVVDDHNVPADEFHDAITTINETHGLGEKLPQSSKNEDGWEILKETRFGTYCQIKDH